MGDLAVEDLTAPHFTKTRLEALSGGTFAVAMTLLVIELEVTQHHLPSNDDLAQTILLQFPTFIACPCIRRRIEARVQ